MFKQSRKKIVAAIMSVLVLLWAGTLSVIYASSYIEMSRQNEGLLKAHAEMYTLSGFFNDIMPPSMPFPGGNPSFADTPVFQLSVFYTVAVSYNGNVIEIKNNPPTVHSDEELMDMALNIINGNKTNGTKNNLSFYKADKNGYILVTFMDNTITNENALTLFRYTLIFGSLTLIVFFFLSVFLAKKIVDPLEESYIKQRQFISDAGHELKTPVSVVSANAELLSREMGDNPWLQNIQYENERMGILVGQLLELARTENVTPKTESINLSRLVAGEALPFESIAFEKGLILNSNIADSISVKGNSTQLRQLISILLDNAIQHSSHPGEITISLAKEHSFARLSVINSGDEIPSEHREKIFERFYRIDSARNSDSGHYGLGLAIAKAVTDSHKGNIEVLCYNGLVEFRVLIPTI